MTAQPDLTPEQRALFEAVYRNAIGTVRALAPILGYKCPIASREEQRGQAQRLAPRATMEIEREGNIPRS